MGVCRSRERAILAAVDGWIDSAEQAELTAHLASCAGCRTAVAEHTAIRQRLGELPLAPVSDDFARRVRQRVESPAWIDFANWRAWTLRLAPLAALLALLVTLPESGRAEARSLDELLESWETSGAGEAGGHLLVTPGADSRTPLDPAPGGAREGAPR